MDGTLKMDSQVLHSAGDMAVIELTVACHEDAVTGSHSFVFPIPIVELGNTFDLTITKVCPLGITHQPSTGRTPTRTEWAEINRLNSAPLDIELSDFEDAFEIISEELEKEVEEVEQMFVDLEKETLKFLVETMRYGLFFVALMALVWLMCVSLDASLEQSARQSEKKERPEGIAGFFKQLLTDLNAHNSIPPERNQDVPSLDEEITIRTTASTEKRI